MPVVYSEIFMEPIFGQLVRNLDSDIAKEKNIFFTHAYTQIQSIFNILYALWIVYVRIVFLDRILSFMGSTFELFVLDISTCVMFLNSLLHSVLQTRLPVCHYQETGL